MKENLLNQLLKLPAENKIINQWNPNPKYNEKLRGKAKSHLFEPTSVKMVRLDDVIQLIENKPLAGERLKTFKMITKADMMKTDNQPKPEIKIEQDDDGVYRMKGITPEIKLAIEQEYNELLKRINCNPPIEDATI